MPGSVVEGKQELKDFVIRNKVQTVLDVGPGEGTYYYALDDAGITKLDGVEIFAPYIDTYGLRHKYNNLFITDIFDFDWDSVEKYDLVILGDVIEHMIESRGREVIAKAVEHAKYVCVSLPIYGYAQGEACGNIYEAHLEQYSDASFREVIKDYELLEAFKGAVIGAYIFKEKE